MAGELGRELLDRLAPRHPIRVQHQTRALWGLSRLALAPVGPHRAAAARGARDRPGRPTRGPGAARSRCTACPPPSWPSPSPRFRPLAPVLATASSTAG